MKAWIAVFGDSTFALRTPTVLAMAATAALIAVLGRIMFRTRVGVIAGLMFAILPTISRFAHETRPYAFVILAVVLATVLLVRAKAEPSRSRWIWYAASVVGRPVAHDRSDVLAGHLAYVVLQ